jgi:hypothetical protein
VPALDVRAHGVPAGLEHLGLAVAAPRTVHDPTPSTGAHGQSLSGLTSWVAKWAWT